MFKLKLIDYQILCKILSKEIENQIIIMNNEKSKNNIVADASVYMNDLIRIYNYFAPKREATNNSFYAKILHFFHNFFK